jgi:hypothetical protein
MSTLTIPVRIDDPINARILSISEDKIQGFQTDPLGEIARQTGVDLATVIERIRAMLQAKTIRRVRQTLMSTNLARGSLVAWVVPEGKLNAAFEWMFQNDPFSGHVVIRSTDQAIAAAKYRLWTTLKVPQGYSMEKHCRVLMQKTGAESFKLMPALRLFALGVGHVRRRGMEPGSKSDELAEVTNTEIVELSELDWRVLTALKREFEPGEIDQDLWQPRAREANVFPRRVLSRRPISQPARRHRSLLNILRARQAPQHRRARHQIQCPFPLGRPQRPRNRNRPTGRPLPHHDPRLLARRRR